VVTREMVERQVEPTLFTARVPKKEIA